MAVTSRQSKADSRHRSQPVASLSVTFDAAVVTGNTILLNICSPLIINTVTDNKGNTYTRDLSADRSGYCSAIWRSHNLTTGQSGVTGGATFTVTATMSSPGWILLVMDEYEAELRPADFNSAAAFTLPEGNNFGARLVVDTIPGTQLAVVGGFASPAFVPGFSLETYKRAELYDGNDSDGLVGEIAIISGAIITGTGLPFEFHWVIAELAGNGVSRPYVAVAGVYYEPIIANFTGVPTSGAGPLTVVFTDSSTGSPTAWLWSFGDGQTSLEQNPTVIYAAGARTYTVGMRASNQVSVSTKARVDYIAVDGGGGGGNPGPTPPGIPTARPSNPFAEAGVPPILGPIEISGLFTGFGEYFSTEPPSPESPEDYEIRIDNELRQEQLDLLPAFSIEGSDDARLQQAIRTVADMVNSLMRELVFTRLNVGGEAGDGEWALYPSGFNSDEAPGLTDDFRIGAQPGMFWIERGIPDKDGNQLPPSVWLCLDNSEGAGLWVECEIYAAGASGSF